MSNKRVTFYIFLTVGNLIVMVY